MHFVEGVFDGVEALVTGAAREEGLGYAFARQLAAEGLSLILVDILPDELAARAAELRAGFGVQVRSVPCDMADTNVIQQIEAAADGAEVDVLVMVGGLMNTQGDTFDSYPQWLISEPHSVVRRDLTAVGRKHMLVPSVPNRLFLLAQTRLMSRRRAVLSIGRFQAKGLGKSD